MLYSSTFEEAVQNVRCVMRCHSLSLLSASPPRLDQSCCLQYFLSVVLAETVDASLLLFVFVRIPQQESLQWDLIVPGWEVGEAAAMQ